MTNPDNKKRMILKTAANLIAQRGYYGVGINEILQACDIPKGSFYYYFPGGKNQLGVEVLRYAYENMEHGIINYYFTVSDNAIEVFTFMATTLANMLETHKDYASSLVITFIGIEASDISQEMEAEAKKIYRRWIQLYADKLQQCGYAKESADTLAPQIRALIHGMTISCWIRKDVNELLNLGPAIAAILQPKA